MRTLGFFHKRPEPPTEDNHTYTPFLFSVEGGSSSDSDFVGGSVNSSEEESLEDIDEESDDISDEDNLGDEETIGTYEVHVGLEEGGERAEQEIPVDDVEADDDVNSEEQEDEDAQKEDEIFGDVQNEESDEDIRYNDVVYPDTPLDTDEEWIELDREDRKKRFEAKKVGEEKFYLGEIFLDKWLLEDAIFWYSMESEYDIKFYRQSSAKMGVKCSQAECPWRLYASVDAAASGWRIRVFIPEHTCNKSSRTKMLKVGQLRSYSGKH